MASLKTTPGDFPTEHLWTEEQMDTAGRCRSTKLVSQLLSLGHEPEISRIVARQFCREVETLTGANFCGRFHGVNVSRSERSDHCTVQYEVDWCPDTDAAWIVTDNPQIWTAPQAPDPILVRNPNRPVWFYSQDEYIVNGWDPINGAWVYRKNDE